MVASGTVTDVMGEKFDVVLNGSNTFKLAVGGTELQATEFADNSWYYGEAVDGVYPYELTYQPGENEKYILKINVPVENARPLTIKYDVTPTDKSRSFDASEANSSATLAYTSTTGESGTYTFPKPMISYSKKYKLTINYKFNNGTRAANSIVKEFEAGDNYSVTSPTINNYVADIKVVSGQMPAEDKVITVIYTPVTPAVVDKPYKLTINYLFEDGTEAAQQHVEEVKSGKPYSVESPVIEGYTPDFAVIEGTMPSTDLSFDVIYKKEETPVEQTYNVVIDYVFEDGSEAAPQFNEQFVTGAEFVVISATLEGYQCDTEVIEGIVSNEDLYYKVTYTKLEDIVDPNAPKVGGNAWSLFNLLCACGTGLQAVVKLFKKNEKTDDEEKKQMTKEQVEKVEEQEKDESKRLNFAKITSAINTALGTELFVMTENMKLPMVFFDKWSPIMATLLVGQIGLMIASKKKEQNEDKKKKENK